MSHTEPAFAISPTAAVILIGNELLSGRTRDTNLAYIAEGLGGHGVSLREARVIPDIESVIVSTLNELRHKFTYVFTTGGIGPTHDDITADCVAAAFDVALPINPEAEALLNAYWQERGIEPNDDRLRMARIPEGGCLIENPVSAAPGFCLGNVYVFAGVPGIMQAMFDRVLPTLDSGDVVQSVSVTCDLGEGTLAGPLRALQEQYPDVDLGSYPGRLDGKLDGKFKVTLVARGTDTDRLATVEKALLDMIAAAGGNILA